jgi:hypothetical protein
MKIQSAFCKFEHSLYLLLVFVVYVLLYAGLTDSIWPAIANFRHMDWKIPPFYDGIIKSVVAPLISGCLVGTMLRRPSSKGWIVLAAPVVFIALLGIASDSLNPPWWSESLSRLLGGLVQGVFAWLGWLLCSWPQRTAGGPGASYLGTRD